MAKIQYSALVNGMSGKLNGSVTSHNKGGSYVRNKGIVSNPNTNIQTAVRQRFGALSSQFRSLTEEQINGWNAAAANFPYTDVFGTPRQLNGIQLYCQLNGNLLAAVSPTIANAPEPQSIPEFSLTLNTLEDTDIELAISDDNVPVGYQLIVQATAPYSPGRRFVKNRFRQIGVVAGGIDLTTFNAIAAYTSVFGTPIVGSRVSLRARLVNTTSGQSSTYVSVAGNVVASTP